MQLNTKLQNHKATQTTEQHSCYNKNSYERFTIVGMFHFLMYFHTRLCFWLRLWFSFFSAIATMYHVFFFVFVFVVCVFVIALILLFQCNHVPASCSKFVTPLLGEPSLAGIHKYPIGRDLFQTNISNGYFLQRLLITSI